MTDGQDSTRAAALYWAEVGEDCPSVFLLSRGLWLTEAHRAPKGTASNPRVVERAQNDQGQEGSKGVVANSRDRSWAESSIRLS